MADDRHWWNGKAAGLATLVGGAGFVLTWALSKAVRTFAARQWHDGWPQLPAALVLASLVVAGLALSARRSRLTSKAAAERELSDARTELDRLERETETLETAHVAAQDELSEVRAGAALLDADRLASDRQKYAELVALLPAQGRSIQFALYHPFDTSWDDDAYFELRKFMHEWDDAAHTFHDREVEAARQSLMASTAAFVMHLATHGFRRRDSSQYRIYPDHDLDWETPDNAFAIKAMHDAGSLGAQVWDDHQALVAAARTRLAV